MRDKVRDNPALPATTGAWAHVIGGLLILALVLWRLVLRFARGDPAAPVGEPNLLTKTGQAGHDALYALMIAMPVTGMLAWFGGVTAMAPLDAEVLKVLLRALIVAQVLAALYHHVIRKDGLLNRMGKPG